MNLSIFAFILFHKIFNVEAVIKYIRKKKTFNFQFRVSILAIDYLQILYEHQTTISKPLTHFELSHSPKQSRYLLQHRNVGCDETNDCEVIFEFRKKKKKKY